MLWLLGALVVDLLVLGSSYSVGNSVGVLIGLGLLAVIGALIVNEYERQRVHHARR